MENPKNDKRTLRIEKRVNEELREIAKSKGKSVNELIVEIVKEWIRGGRKVNGK